MKHQKPLIGILGSRKDDAMMLATRYLNSMWREGAIGVLLPYTTNPDWIASFADTYDGFLFAGGIDLNPTLYGEEKQFDSVDIDDERDAFEAGMFKAIYPTEKPIFGICRGIQAINVFLGGTLYQDMPGHRQSVPGCERSHTVKVVPDSLLYNLCHKLEINVNSFHHQNIKDLAPSLVADGISPDGYVEAVHDPSHPFLLAVQFHPEIYHGQEKEDDNHAHLMFKAFVDACKASAEEG